MILTLKIEGMSCQHCIKALEKEFEKFGFKDFSIEIGMVKFEMDDIKKINTELISKIIENAGFKLLSTND
jgi:copper chaperone